MVVGRLYYIWWCETTFITNKIKSEVDIVKDAWVDAISRTGRWNTFNYDPARSINGRAFPTVYNVYKLSNKHRKTTQTGSAKIETPFSVLYVSNIFPFWLITAPIQYINYTINCHRLPNPNKIINPRDLDKTKNVYILSFIQLFRDFYGHFTWAI